MSRARDFADLAGSADAGGLTGRNLIINGAMQVAQRGTSALTLSGTSQYPVDRFHASRDTAGVTATIQQDSTVPNSTFTNSLKVSVTTGASVGASDDGFVRYKVEGYDASRLGFGGSGAEPMSFSFWVRSSQTGTFGVAFGNSAADRGYNATYTVSAANTWEHKTITVAGDTSGTWLTTNGNGMFIAFDIGSGSSRSRAASSSWETSYLPGLTGGVKVLETTGATWYITGVQLEVGEQATPFEHRSYGDELARCQRYYWQVAGTAKIVGQGFYYSTGEVNCIVNLPQTMRAAPTFTPSNNSNDFYVASNNDFFDTWTAQQFFDGSRVNVYTISGVSGTKGDSSYIRLMNSTSKVQFDAEL